jgi:hypothetical protein
VDAWAGLQVTAAAADRPTISILTPVWNGLPHLRECVESVYAQGFTDWELLLSDDGSTDGSGEYLATLDDPRVVVFHQPLNLGIFANLNFLFARARAPLAQILCQDDFFTTAASLGSIVAWWANAEDEVAFMRMNWGVDIERGRRGLRSLSATYLPPRILPQDSTLYFYLFGCLPGNLSNVSLRTSLVDELGGFDQRLPYGGDFDFWSRASKTRPFALEPGRWTHVRGHPGQASFHLNQRGEKVSQLFSLIERFYLELDRDYPRHWLRLHATLVYYVPECDAAIRRLRSPEGRDYMRAVKTNSHRSMFFPAGARWLLFVASAGGRTLRYVAVQKLLRMHARRGATGACVKDHGNSPGVITGIPHLWGWPVRAGRRALMASRWRRMR